MAGRVNKALSFGDEMEHMKRQDSGNRREWNLVEPLANQPVRREHHGLWPLWPVRVSLFARIERS